MRNKLIFAFALLFAAGGSLPSLAANTWVGSRPNQAPANSFGAEGDWFIDAASGKIYGPKTSGSWTTNSASNYLAGESALTLTNTFGGM